MNKRIQVLPHADKAFDAKLTTNHPVSSYGLPVVVIGDTGYGPADLNVKWPKYQINVPDKDHDAEDAARRAGYRVYVEVLGE